MTQQYSSADIQAINLALGTNFPLDAQTIAMDSYVAGVAQTAPNGGIPAMLTTFLSPKWIEFLTAPMNAAKAFDEKQFGDRVTTNIAIPTFELYGETSSYGDFNDNGMSNDNENYEYRQPYAYQTNIKIGEIAEERAAAARFSLVERQIQATTLTLNKTQNAIYLYGVQGLKNYGLLNDPDLLPDSVGANWAILDSLGLYNEVLKLFTQLVTQSNGLVQETDAMTLVLSPKMNARLLASNQYGLNAMKYIKDNLPNLKIVPIPEYSTASGEKVQLVLDSYMGQETIHLGFVDKLRTHKVEVKTSGFLQKRSQSTIGAIIYYPMLVANMLASYDETP